MHYEIHLTFNKDIKVDQIGMLQDIAVKHGGKILLIDLISQPGTAWSQMAHPSQLMFGRKIELNDDMEAANWANYVKTFFDEFHPVRLKLEAEMSDGPAKYFEAHWKVMNIHAPAMLNFLRSRSVFDRTKLYVSSRAKTYKVAAEKFLRDKQIVIENHGRHFHVDNDHFERVIVDTNPMTDYGWDPGVKND